MVVMMELEGVKALAFLEERQQQSDLHCPGVLLRRGSHCLSVHFHCRQQHSSQERPTKILASLLLSVSCADALAGGKVVSEVIILCLVISPGGGDR